MFIFKGKVVKAGQWVLLASKDSAVITISNCDPRMDKKASFLGVWYRAGQDGKLRRFSF